MHMKCEWDMPDIICEVTFRRFQSSMLEKQFGTFALTVVFLLCQNFKLAMLTIFPVIQVYGAYKLTQDALEDNLLEWEYKCKKGKNFRRAFLFTAFGIARIWRVDGNKGRNKHGNFLYIHQPIGKCFRILTEYAGHLCCLPAIQRIC